MGISSSGICRAARNEKIRNPALMEIGDRVFHLSHARGQNEYLNNFPNLDYSAFQKYVPKY